MGKNDIEISVIVPTYNCEQVLEGTLRSIFEQECSSYECIVVDGLSTDRTVDIAFEYKKRHGGLVLISSCADEGIYDAMNKGVKMAHGTYIVFMGAGDTFADKMVLSQIRRYNDDIVYGYVRAYNESESYFIRNKMNLLTSFVYRPICHQAIFAKRKILLEYPFELRYKYVADQAWILKMYSLHKKFRYVDKLIANYGLNGFSSTEQGRCIAIEEINDARSRYLPTRNRITKLAKKILAR